jgi:hypothetical protein
VLALRKRSIAAELGESLLALQLLQSTASSGLHLRAPGRGGLRVSSAADDERGLASRSDEDLVGRVNDEHLGDCKEGGAGSDEKPAVDERETKANGARGEATLEPPQRESFAEPTHHTQIR